MTLPGLFGTAIGQDAAGGGGVSEKVLIRDYVGDATNNREIDLGDDYQEVHIYIADSFAINADHLAEVYAIGTVYGVLYNSGSTSTVRHSTMASGNSRWQGKMTGGDANKIKLGSSGASAGGSNASGVNYRIIAKKFSSVEA